VLDGLKKAARLAKKGLWADPLPVPPWEVAETDQVVLLDNLSHDSQVGCHHP
jgi:hypothetical protein